VLTGMLRLEFVHVDLEASDVDPGLFRKLRIASFPIPSGALLIAGSSRSDFPTRIERLLLRVAANQVTLWQAGATRTERYLAEGQRLSHTGSWAENKITGEVFWSDEMLRIFACEPGTSITFQKIIEERVHPDDRAALLQKAERTMREKRDIDLEHRIVFPTDRSAFITSSRTRSSTPPAKWWRFSARRWTSATARWPWRAPGARRWSSRT
jgi:hypothetical protein